MMRKTTDAAALAEFRNFLYAIGVKPKKDEAGGSIDPEEARKVLRQEGKLPEKVLFFRKISFFTRGVVLGTRESLQEMEPIYKITISRRTRLQQIPLQTEIPLCCYRR